MKLIKSLSIYSLTNILMSAIPFLLLPVITANFTKGEYGILALVNVTTAFLADLIYLGSGTSIYLEYFKIKEENLPSFISSVAALPMISFLFVITAIYITKTPLAHHLNLSTGLLLLIPCFAIIRFYPYILGILYQIKENPLDYAKLQLSLIILNVAISYILIAFFQMSYAGRLIGIYLPYMLFTFVALWQIHRMGYLFKKIRFRYIKESLAIGVPLIPHQLGLSIINMSDRYFISMMVGFESVGLYALGYQFGMMINLLVGSVNQSFSPYQFKVLKDPDMKAKSHLIKITYTYVMLFILVFLAIYAVSPLMFRFFIAPKFTQALDFIFWIGLGYVFYGIYTLVINYLYFIKKTYLLSILTISASVLNLILNYIFIKIYGTIGAAYATAASFFIFSIAAWILSNKYYPMPWFSFWKH